MPEEFGAWQTVYDRFTQWRNVGGFAALMEGMIAEAARRGQADMSLVSVDSTVARAHHDAAGMVLESAGANIQASDRILLRPDSEAGIEEAKRLWSACLMDVLSANPLGLVIHPDAVGENQQRANPWPPASPT
jgi:hypothetical protein